MLYVIFYSIFVFFGTLSNFAAVASAVPLSPSTEELIAKGICVHATRIMPKLDELGQMVIAPKSLSFNDLEEPPVTLEHHINRSDRVFNPRPTIHFSYGGLAATHSNWSYHPNYIILEPYRNLAESMYGGYIEDLFIFGPHVVSTEARILVPQPELLKCTRERDEKYAARFHGYDPKGKKLDIVAHHIKAMGGWDIRVIQEHVFVKEGKPVPGKMIKGKFLAKEKGFTERMESLEQKYNHTLVLRPDKITRDMEDYVFSTVTYEISINDSTEFHGSKYYENVFLKNLLQTQRLFRGEYVNSLLSAIEFNSNIIFAPLIFANIYFDNQQNYADDKLMALGNRWKKLLDKHKERSEGRQPCFIEMEAKRRGIALEEITPEAKGAIISKIGENPLIFLRDFMLAQFDTLEADMKDRSQSARDYFSQWKSEFMNWLSVLGLNPDVRGSLQQQEQQRLTIYNGIFQPNFYNNPKKLQSLFKLMNQANKLIEEELKKRIPPAIPPALSAPAAASSVSAAESSDAPFPLDPPTKISEDKAKEGKKKKKKKAKAVEGSVPFAESSAMLSSAEDPLSNPPTLSAPAAAAVGSVPAAESSDVSSPLDPPAKKKEKKGRKKGAKEGEE